MTDSVTAHLVGVGIPTLRELRSALIASNSPDDAVTALREAGFAGGEAVYGAFEHWLTESGGEYDADGWDPGDPGQLTLDEFGERAARFFHDAGWGDVTFSHDEAEGIAIVDITSCWEGATEESGAAHGCQITTGLLAAFFGRIAGYPIAVLETECCHGDGSPCRFLMGNAEVMDYKWQEMQ